MDTVVGPIAAGIGGGVVYQLVGHGLGWHPEVVVRRAMQMAFALVVFITAVALISTVDLSSVASTNRNLALRLDNTEARLTTMEQIIQNMEKQNSEMMSNSGTSTSSKNPGSVITEEEEDHHNPQRDEATFSADKSLDDSQDEEEAKDSQDEEEATTKQSKPWRIYKVPDDHVFVVDCVGDKLRVLIRPPASYNLDQQNKVADEVGSAEGVCGEAREVGTPTMFEGESYRTLFWQVPGDERVVVPVPWPGASMWHRISMALLLQRWDENPPTVEEKAPPESFTIAADEVLFYSPSVGREAKVVIAAREDAVHLEWHPETPVPEGVEIEEPAITALPPHAVLPLTFTDSQRAKSPVRIGFALF